MTSPSTDRRYGLNSSAAIKVPVAAATTAAITLSGEQTVDGVAIVADDRVLVKNQSDQTTNGIYIADTSTWTRDVDFDDNRDMVTGTFVTVSAGTVNANTWWEVSTTGDITVDTSNLTFTQVNMLSYTEPVQQTVASAATGADIWAADGVVDWTGTETTTDFADATRAGQRRLLICAGACKFTTGANLIFEGIQSGVTITMKANALVNVLALSTTQFKCTYSLSGSFTATGTGFATADPTATWYYNVTNGAVHITPHNTTMGGVNDSNATTFTITGFPAEITPENPTEAKDTRLFLNLVGKDNGSYVYTVYGTLDETSVLTLYPTPAAGNWTASGAKLLVAQELYYSL